jgi:hypothetical protein
VRRVCASGQDGTCQSGVASYATLSNVTTAPKCDQESLMALLDEKGPIGVRMNPFCESFMSYSSGIIDEDCRSGWEPTDCTVSAQLLYVAPGLS